MRRCTVINEFVNHMLSAPSLLSRSTETDPSHLTHQHGHAGFATESADTMNVSRPCLPGMRREESLHQCTCKRVDEHNGADTFHSVFHTYTLVELSAPSQPVLAALTRTTAAAPIRSPSMPTNQATPGRQHRHCETSISTGMLIMLMRDDQPTLAVHHPSVHPLH